MKKILLILLFAVSVSCDEKQSSTQKQALPKTVVADKYGLTAKEKEILSQVKNNTTLDSEIKESYKILKSQFYFIDTEIIRFTALSKKTKGTEYATKVEKTRDSLIKNQSLIAKKQLKESEAKTAAEESAARKTFEKDFENNLLDNGLNMKVAVSGKENRHIKITYILFNDVWRRKFETEGYLQQLNDRGFKKITLSDGYDYNIYFTYD